MRIREIIFQGVLGCDSPVRLATAPGVDRMSLPASLSTVDVHALIFALFYPDRIPPRLAEEFGGDQKIKLAIVFETDGKEYRVLRRGDISSLRLQVKEDGSFQSVVKGEKATSEALESTVGMPDFEAFATLNLWRFDDDALFAHKAGLSGLDDTGRELIEKYRTAVEVESLEDRIKNLEAELHDQKSELGQGAKVEEKLEQARTKFETLRLDDLADEDLALLADKDERVAEFNHQLDRLSGQEEDERIALDSKLPERPWNDPQFWAGLGIGVAAIAVSIALSNSLRQIAAVNVVGLGLVAWVMLKYFTDLERASVHKVRLESIKRRLNQVREKEVAYREKINHLLIHAGVEDENELFERVEKTHKLEDIIAQLETKVTEIRRVPSHKAASKRISEINSEREQLDEQRAELPEFVMSTFQLEGDLRSVGVDPHEVLADDDDDAESDEPPKTAFGRLKLVAERTGQWSQSGSGGELTPRTRKMWGKICGHVLSDRFKGVELTADAQLCVRDFSDDQLEMWRRTRSSEERILSAALALALHVNTADRSGGHFETIWVNDPRDDFGSDVADAFDEVFESAAKKSHIILCSG
jgi:hypothetical protein